MQRNGARKNNELRTMPAYYCLTFICC